MDNIEVLNGFNFQSLPKSYVLPPEKRPGNLVVPLCKTILIIDLGSPNRTETIQQILRASEEFGFFQKINHGVSNSLMDETMGVFKEFHSMPAKEKADAGSKDPTNASREVVERYSIEVKNLGSRILELIGEGLGLGMEYLDGGFTESPVLYINHYPPCPDPSLTLWSAEHRDPTISNILLQGDVFGLQVFKDEEWVGVPPLPQAFLVNVGYQLQVISNGRLVAAEHRVVTNPSIARTTASFFIYPSEDSIIGPAKAVIDECRSPPHDGAFHFKDFLSAYRSYAEAIKDFISPSSNEDTSLPCDIRKNPSQ